MKKLLLIAALAASMGQAKADDFGQYFKLTYNNQEITNGQTIVFDNYTDPYYDLIKQYPELQDFLQPGEYESIDYIYFHNLSKTAKKLEYNMSLTEPSKLAAAMGSVAICYKYMWTGFGNCVGLSSPDNIEDVPAGEQLELKFEHLTFTDKTPLTYKLDVWASEGGEKVAEASYTVVFSNKNDVSLGVEGIEAAEQSERYYNLQGVEVSHPEKGGLYIVRKGGKTTKQIF